MTVAKLWRALVGWLLLAVVSGNAWAVKTVTWNKTPIPIRLVVGVEQMVHLEGPATVGLPPALAQGEVFRHLFASDTMYWKALRPFEKQRIKVRLNASAQIVLFDVRAVTRKKPPKAVPPMSVIMPKVGPTPSPQAHDAPQNKPRNSSLGSMIDVLRSAVQADYAPARVVKVVRGMSEVKNTVRGDISALYAHSDAEYLDMRVQRMWAAKGFYVTSVLVRNRTANELTVDPSRFQHSGRHGPNGLSNQFLAAATIRHVLGPRGANVRPDSTRFYLVTDKPFATVIGR